MLLIAIVFLNFNHNFTEIKIFDVEIVTMLAIWQKTAKKESDQQFAICVEPKAIFLITVRTQSAYDVGFQTFTILILAACTVDG